MTIQTLSPRLVAAAEGPTYRVVADMVTFKAVGDDTSNAYSLFESRTPPGMGTPPHLQRYEDETFLVLEGVYTFLVGDTRHELRQGDYAFVPRGTIHAFTNTGATTAHLLIMVTPGGLHEQFFAEAGEFIADPNNPPAPAGPPDVPRLIAIAAKYGIEILPPPA